MKTSAHLEVGISSTYSNYLAYCSGAEFLPEQNQVVSRDYLTTKMWDLRVERPFFSA